MKRYLVLLTLVGVLVFGFAGAAYGVTVKSLTAVDSLTTKVVLDAGADSLDTALSVKVYSGTTLVKSTTATLKREYTKTWSNEGEEPGYVYTWGDYYALVRLDAATMAAWRAGTLTARFSVWAWGTGRQTFSDDLMIVSAVRWWAYPDTTVTSARRGDYICLTAHIEPVIRFDTAYTLVIDYDERYLVPNAMVLGLPGATASDGKLTVPRYWSRYEISGSMSVYFRVLDTTPSGTVLTNTVTYVVPGEIVTGNNAGSASITIR